MSSEACRSPPDVSDLPHWPPERAGSTPWCSFPQHLPLTLCLQPLHSLQSTWMHPGPSTHTTAALQLAAQGSTEDTDHLGFSLSAPGEIHVLCIADGLQRIWRARSVLYTKLSEDKALFLGCEFRRKEDLCWGGWRLSAELKLFSWFPFVLVNYLTLWANEKFIALLWCD